MTKRVMSMNVDGHSSRGRPKTRWMDCVKDDIRTKGVSMEMKNDRREWKKITCCAHPTYWNKRTLMMSIEILLS
jgi:hypothetical protein